MNKKIIIKAIIMLLIFNVFLILANAKVQANASSDISSLDISIDSVIESAEEENIVCYDAATGKTTEVDMEELKQVLISTYGENYASASTSAYISSPKKNSFNLQPVATPYATTAISFNRVPNTTIRPYSAICKITCSGGSGTGFLVSSNKLLTAAHCVINPDTNEVFSNWGCYPAYSNGIYNGYSEGWRRIYYDKRWFENHSGAYDWCLCIIGKNLGDSVGSCSVEVCVDSYLKNASIKSIGYPGAKELSSGKYQYYSNGTITQVEPLYLSRNGQLQKGMSGGPTMRTSDNHVVAINAGLYRNDSTQTCLTRITDSIFNLVISSDL